MAGNKRERRPQDGTASALRVALYARVSTDDQADRGTVDSQRAFIRSYADLYGLKIADEYIDDGISGTISLSDRPAGKRLLADARDGQFAVVIVYRLDRLARSLKALMDAHAELESAGVDIRSASEPFDTSAPIGRFLFQLLGSMAELEKSTIIERMSLGRDRVAKQGKWTGGHVPYGFDVNEDGVVIPSEHLVPVLGVSESEVAREIFNRIAEGSSILAEAQRLVDLGVPAVRQYGKGVTRASSGWAPSRISYMLKNTAYKGLITLKSRHGTIVREVPPLVTAELWDKAQKQVQRNKKVRTRRESDRLYLLRGLITCQDCGAGFGGFPMHRKQKGETRITYYYRCNTAGAGFIPASGRACAAKYLNAEQLERQVWEDCRSFLLDPGVALNEAQAKLNDRRDSAPIQLRDLQLLQGQLREKERERERVLALYRRGTITVEDVEAQLAEVARETERFSAMIESTKSEHEFTRASEIQLTSATAALATMRARLDDLEESGDLMTRHEIVQKLVSRITVRTEGQGRSKKAWMKIQYVLNDPAEWLSSSTARRTSRFIARMRAR